MGATASIGIPRWQEDPECEASPYANETTRARLKEKLRSKEYVKHMTEAGEVNEELKDAFLKMVGSPDEDAIGCMDDDDYEAIDRHRLAAETILGVTTRLRNQFIYNFLIVVMSFLFLFYSVPGPIWAILQQQRIVFGKKWIENLGKEMGDEFAVWPDDASTVLAVCATDNKAYFAKTKLQHVQSDIHEGPKIRANGEFLHTANRIHLPLYEEIEYHAKGDWRGVKSTQQFLAEDYFSHDFSDFKQTCWRHFFGVHRSGGNILHHPNYDPHGAHGFVYDEPVLDVSTAAYPDVEEILCAIQADLVDGGPRLSSVFVYGDQQTFDRILNLIGRYPDRFSWVIPVPGDFHFMAHCYFSMNRLWWEDITSWAVSKMGFEKTVKQETDNMDYYIHYDRFYSMLTLAIMVVFSSVFDFDILADPSVVFAMCGANECAVLLCRFLYDCGFPLLSLRMGIRSNKSDIIDEMWRYMCGVFKATNKNQYAKLSVLSQYIIFGFRDSVMRIFRKYRTASLRGNRGRNVGWDFCVERFNLECQVFMGSHVTKERLLTGVRILNGIRHIRNESLRAFGISQEDSRESTGVLPSDLEMLVGVIKSELGLDGVSDFDILTSRCVRRNQFRPLSGEVEDQRKPWDFVDGNRGEIMREYVVRILKENSRQVRVDVHL